MALEKDLELLDDYLANRLSERDRVDFEKKLEADPELKREFLFQQNLVEGIRNSRVAELKSMLTNIPVPPSVSTGSITIKIIGSLMAAGIIATGIYYILTQDDQADVVVSEQIENFKDEGSERFETNKDSSISALNSDTSDSRIPETVVSPLPRSDKSVSATEPMDATLQRERDLVKIVSSTFVTSSTDVVTDNSSPNYNFHYAFRNNKLMLYGSFEQSQYQILEFITAKEHAFFLSYKANYYLLDNTNTSPTPLVPIRDAKLFKQLKEFRAR